jgi:site-specific DNA-methyltransferase (adenine-specific)
MKPYYQDNAVTIYLGDCREILPQIEPVDLVLTDPPYGISYKHSGAGLMSTVRHSEAVTGDDKIFDAKFLLEYSEVIIWGANHFCHSLPQDKGRWLIWDKADGRHDIDSFGDAELGWHSIGRAARIFRYAWKGVCCVKVGEDNGNRYHPTMKPQGLMRWCISLSKSTGTILDPFMGSGTTLRAAKDLGRKAIGIEIEEKYCEIAARRMSQEVLNLEWKENTKMKQFGTKLF